MIVRAICVNDKDKPNEIPNNKWVKENELYHIIEISNHPLQGNIHGCKLKEVNLNGCEPFEYYKLDRFAIFEEDLDKFIELLQACTDMNYLDITHAIKTQQQTQHHDNRN